MIKTKRDVANETLTKLREWCSDQTGTIAWPSSFNSLTEQVWYSEHKDKEGGWEVGFTISAKPRAAYFNFSLAVYVRDSIGAYTSIEVDLSSIKKNGKQVWSNYAEDVFRSMKYLCRTQAEFLAKKQNS